MPAEVEDPLFLLHARQDGKAECCERIGSRFRDQSVHEGEESAAALSREREAFAS
jgi:hypothetical protein